MPNANRDAGLQAERDAAAYFRDNGMPNADRRIVTGWRAGGRSSTDPGDIKGIPGVCVQVKNVYRKDRQKTLTGKALTDALAEARTQAESTGAALYLLLEKRNGHANPGEWWAHLPANLFAALMTGADPYSYPLCTITHPVRVELRGIITQLAAFAEMCTEAAA